MTVEPHHLPTRWLPIGQFGTADDRASLPLAPPPDSEWRALEDFGRGFPAYHTEHAWIADDFLHFVTVAGFTFAPQPDGANEQELLDRRRIPMSSITRVTLNVPGPGGTVTLTSGETVDDWPAEMIYRHIS
jgi:hypothetical protein